MAEEALIRAVEQEESREFDVAFNRLGDKDTFLTGRILMVLRAMFGRL